MIDPQQDSSCTFDPHLQTTNQNPFDQGLHQEPEPTFDKSTPENNMYHSSNPFDVNYVPTGLEPAEGSPQPESSKINLIQNVSVYTTSRAQAEMHQEFRKIAYAPIDPDFNMKLQQELEKQTQEDKENWQPGWTGNNQNSQGYSDSRQKPYYQSEPLESPQYSNQELDDTYEQGPEQDQGYEAQYESNGDTQQSNSIQDFVKNSIANFLQDPLTSSMQALQCLSVQQQKELAQTLQVIQSIQPGLQGLPMEMMPLMDEMNTNTNGSDRSSRNFYQKKNHGGFGGRNGGYQNRNSEMQQIRVSNISTEKLVEIIEQNQINVISLLNETSTKIKKKIEYNVREIPMGRLKAFECACFLQKFKIGQKRGPSKQSAKADASKEALLTLLSSNSFTNERMTIISIVQRMTGKNLITGVAQPSKSYRANPHDFHINLLKGGDSQSHNSNENRRSAPMSRGEPNTNSNGFHESDPSVVELNNLGRQLNAKPIWNIKPIQETGEYEAQVTLQEETVKLVRPTKHDAMREAAFELLDKVKTKTEAEALLKRNLEVSKMQTEKPKKELGSQGSEKHGRKRRLFESCIEDEFFNDLQSENQLSKEYMQKTNSEFELYLCSNIPKYQPNAVDTQIFYEVFDKLKDYTTTAINEEKPELAEGEKHITEYVNQYHLVSVGSFALECMRNDDPVLDILFIFKELKEVNELEFLEMYCYALERSQNLKQEDEEEGECSTDTKFAFEIKTEEARNYLEIQEVRKSHRPLKVRIFLSPLVQKEGAQVEPLFLEKYNYSILHIKGVLKCFEDMESQLKDFRRLLLVLRAWRSTNKLEFLRTEILDIILLREFLNYKFTSFANPVINCLMVLNSEETIKNFLSQYDSYYMDYFLKLSEENKKELFEACKKTMSGIFSRNFKDAGLFREQQQ